MYKLPPQRTALAPDVDNGRHLLPSLVQAVEDGHRFLSQNLNFCQVRVDLALPQRHHQDPDKSEIPVPGYVSIDEGID